MGYLTTLCRQRSEDSTKHLVAREIRMYKFLYCNEPSGGWRAKLILRPYHHRRSSIALRRTWKSVEETPPAERQIHIEVFYFSLLRQPLLTEVLSIQLFGGRNPPSLLNEVKVQLPRTLHYHSMLRRRVGDKDGMIIIRRTNSRKRDFFLGNRIKHYIVNRHV